MSARLRVLVACEFSGIVRDAFARRGHDAWSCDLLPSETPGNHIIGDAVRILNSGEPFGPLPDHGRLTWWDLLIAHPPCTYLANSGVRWLDSGENGERMAHMILASQFFNALLGEEMFCAARHIPRVCIENPIQHRYARARIRKHDQIIQPWQHGHGETKATCLWLKGLPPLVPSNVVEGRTPRVHYASPGPERWKERSRTLPGIAEAMAAQWGT